MLISEIPKDVDLEGEALLLHDQNTVLNDVIIRSSSMDRIPQEPYEIVLNDLFRKVFVPGTLSQVHHGRLSRWHARVLRQRRSELAGESRRLAAVL